MNDLVGWIPAISTTALLSAALWLARKAIEARITRAIQHEFDGRLESIRSELRQSEEQFKAQLREKETEIEALRSGTLAGLATRKANLDKRRLEAVEQLWTALHSLGGARWLATSLSVIKFESAAKIAETDAKARQMFEVMGVGFDQSKIDNENAVKAQPFVSPMAWAVFSAYRAVVMHGVMRWHVLKSGLGPNDFFDNKAVEKLIVTALPHFSDYIAQHGPSVYANALEQLEEKLLAELQAMLNSTDGDRATIAQAAEIIREANALQTATVQAKVRATSTR